MAQFMVSVIIVALLISRVDYYLPTLFNGALPFLGISKYLLCLVFHPPDPYNFLFCRPNLCL
jgi:hypothetical protein